MCGRQRCNLQPENVQGFAKAAADVPDDEWVDREAYRPTNNVSPGFSTPVIRRGGAPGFTLHTMRWGLVPRFESAEKKPDFWRMFNARSEGLPNSPVFRRLLPASRCVVIADGFYEWRSEHKVKQPYYVHMQGDAPMCFAGLYDSWRDAAGAEMFTYTVITTSSAPRLRWLHDRMPVVLDGADCKAWLSGSAEAALRLLRPFERETLVWHPVTTAMSRAGYNAPDCCAPLKRATLSALFQRAKAPAHAPTPEQSSAEARPEADADGGEVSGACESAAEAPDHESGQPAADAVAGVHEHDAVQREDGLEREPAKSARDEFRRGPLNSDAVEPGVGACPAEGGGTSPECSAQAASLAAETSPHNHVAGAAAHVPSSARSVPDRAHGEKRRGKQARGGATPAAKSPAAKKAKPDTSSATQPNMLAYFKRPE